MNQPRSSTTIPMGMLMRKIQRQPTASTMKPPRGGPTVKPMYTAMTLMPRARPRSFGGKTAVTMAAEVAPMSAAPPPWMMRETMSQEPFMLTAHSSEATVKMAMPRR